MDWIGVYILSQIGIIIVLVCYILSDHRQISQKVDRIDYENFKKELEITGWPLQLKSLKEWGEVDESIIPLINTLNRYGILTCGSCSGHSRKEGYVEISSKSCLIEHDDSGKKFFLLKIESGRIREIEKMLGETRGAKKRKISQL